VVYIIKGLIVDQPAQAICHICSIAIPSSFACMFDQHPNWGRMHKAKRFVSCKIRPLKKDEQIVCPNWQLLRTISNYDGT